jgi:hypothetical protein
MNWAERTIAADPFLSPHAYALVVSIGRYFCMNKRCAFYDSEAGALIGISSSEARSARHELMRKHFLAEVHSPNNGKPRYSLCDAVDDAA